MKRFFYNYSDAYYAWSCKRNEMPSILLCLYRGEVDEVRFFYDNRCCAVSFRHSDEFWVVRFFGLDGVFRTLMLPKLSLVIGLFEAESFWQQFVQPRVWHAARGVFHPLA